MRQARVGRGARGRALVSRPVVAPATEEFYAALPGMYRDADAAAPDDGAPGSGYPLLRWLALVLDRYDAHVASLIARFATTGDLVDPALADEAWLPLVAMLAGIDPRVYSSAAQLRVALAGADDARAVGSTGAVLAAVRPLLTGSRTVDLIARDPAAFSYTVRAYRREVPDVDALAAVLEATRPAGLLAQLQLADGESYDQQRSRALTYDQLRAFTPDQTRTAVPGQPIA